MSIGPQPGPGGPPPFITVPGPGGAPSGPQAGGQGEPPTLLGHIRAALDLVMVAHAEDRDEVDKVKYLTIAKLLQDLLAKNQQDVQQAVGGSGSGIISRLLGKSAPIGSAQGGVGG